MPLDDATWHASLRRVPGRTRARVRELGRQVVGRPHADFWLRLRLTEEVAGLFLGAVEARRTELQAATATPPPPVPGVVPAGAADSVVDHAGQLRSLAPEASEVRASAGPVTTPCAADGGTPPGPHPPAGTAHREPALPLGASGPEPPPSLLAARSFSEAGLPVPSWVGLLGLLEDYADTWDDPEGMPRRAADAIYQRDGWRCMAPGCTSRRNLEDHHVEYRSRGGDDDLSNRVCLCQFHHRQGEHGTAASVQGEAPLGLDWRLGPAGGGDRSGSDRGGGGDVGVSGGGNDDTPPTGRWFRNERRLDLRRRHRNLRAAPRRGAPSARSA